MAGPGAVASRRSLRSLRKYFREQRPIARWIGRASVVVAHTHGIHCRTHARGSAPEPDWNAYCTLYYIEEVVAEVGMLSSAPRGSAPEPRCGSPSSKYRARQQRDHHDFDKGPLVAAAACGRRVEAGTRGEGG